MLGLSIRNCTHMPSHKLYLVINRDVKQILNIRNSEKKYFNANVGLTCLIIVFKVLKFPHCNNTKVLVSHLANVQAS